MLDPYPLGLQWLLVHLDRLPVRSGGKSTSVSPVRIVYDSAAGPRPPRFESAWDWTPEPDAS